MLCLVLIVVCSLVVVSLFLPGSAGIFFHEEKMRGWAERPPVRRQYCTGTVVKHQRDIDWFSRKKRKIVKKNENKKKKNVFWDKIAIFNKSEVKTQEVRVNMSLRSFSFTMTMSTSSMFAGHHLSGYYSSRLDFSK